MLAPVPRLARKASRGRGSRSQSADCGESSSRRRPPLRSRVVAFSFGIGGFGSVVEAHAVLRASRAFLDRVCSSRRLRARLGVLSKLIRTCRCLISLRLRICMCEYGIAGVNWGGEGFGGVAATWLYVFAFEVTLSDVTSSFSCVCCIFSRSSSWDLVASVIVWRWLSNLFWRSEVMGISDSRRWLVMVLEILSLIPFSILSVIRYATERMGLTVVSFIFPVSTTREKRVLAKVSSVMSLPGRAHPLANR